MVVRNTCTNIESQFGYTVEYAD